MKFAYLQSNFEIFCFREKPIWEIKSLREFQIDYKNTFSKKKKKKKKKNLWKSQKMIKADGKFSS